ncbi:MAG: hypothetical protein AAGF13_11100 [Pseudomonadota bacterium]
MSRVEYEVILEPAAQMEVEAFVAELSGVGDGASEVLVQYGIETRNYRSILRAWHAVPHKSGEISAVAMSGVTGFKGAQG